jgi:hypothetical protein
VRPSACGGCVECADPSSLTFFVNGGNLQGHVGLPSTCK